MRLRDYARNHRKRKEYVQHPGLLLVGVDESEEKVRKKASDPLSLLRRFPLFRRGSSGINVEATLGPRAGQYMGLSLNFTIWIRDDRWLPQW